MEACFFHSKRKAMFLIHFITHKTHSQDSVPGSSQDILFRILLKNAFGVEHFVLWSSQLRPRYRR